MADEGGRKIADACVISKTLDFCKSPTAPVGYLIVGKLDQSIREAPTVNMTGKPVFTSFSRVATVIGNEAGVGGGVASLVNKGMCKPIQWSHTVRVAGQWATMNSNEMWMNCAGPEGSGNVMGTLVYIKCSTLAVVTPSGEIKIQNSEQDKQQSLAPPSNESSPADGVSDGVNDGGAESAESDDGTISRDSPSPEEQEILDEISNTEAEVAQTEAEIASAEADVAKLDAEIALEIAQGTADVAGLFDPSPTSDAISAGISVKKGDYFGAVLSGVSMVPYLGDLLAKPVKAARGLKVLEKLRHLYKAAKALAGKLLQKLGKLKDKLAKLKDRLKDIRKKKTGGAKQGKGGSGEVRIVKVPSKVVPKKAEDILAEIKKRNGSPPQGYKGGKVFENTGGTTAKPSEVLPKSDAVGNPITYKEYDVNPYQKGVNRGPERIVVGSDGTGYYTSDHYTTFTRME